MTWSLATPRLTLRHLSRDDASFIVQVYNDPDFIRFVGDRGLKTVELATRWLEAEHGPLASYARNGFGLFAVELTASRTPIGVCGLIRRSELDDVDVGFALLPAFRGCGYALEAARAVLEFGNKTINLDTIVAITDPANVSSQRLLVKLGMHFERFIRWPGEHINLALYST